MGLQRGIRTQDPFDPNIHSAGVTSPHRPLPSNGETLGCPRAGGRQLRPGLFIAGPRSRRVRGASEFLPHRASFCQEGFWAVPGTAAFLNREGRAIPSGKTQKGPGAQGPTEITLPNRHGSRRAAAFACACRGRETGPQFLMPGSDAVSAGGRKGRTPRAKRPDPTPFRGPL